MEAMSRGSDGHSSTSIRVRDGGLTKCDGLESGLDEELGNSVLATS